MTLDQHRGRSLFTHMDFPCSWLCPPPHSFIPSFDILPIKHLLCPGLRSGGGNIKEGTADTVPDLTAFTAWWGKQKTWEAITIEGGKCHNRKARSIILLTLAITATGKLFCNGVFKGVMMNSNDLPVGHWVIKSNSFFPDGAGLEMTLK